MKELSIKEKAKHYDEALKVLHKYDGANIMFSQSLKEEMFPELKEESEDEKIRKELISHFCGIRDNCGKNWYGFNINDVIAWLEKQGEQSPIDKIEPKFRVDDWITNNVDTNKIIGIDLKNEDYIFENGISDISLVDNINHLWTIHDSKDGDFLVCGKDRSPFIFKGFDKFHPDCPVAYCGICSNGEFCISTGDGWWTDEEVFPATKGQIEQLLKKIADEGYEWDAEKKELKKIERNPTQEIEPTPIFRIGDILKRKGKDYTFRVDRIQGGYYHCDRNHGAFFPIEEQGNWELVEQKPAWSEEDEENLNWFEKFFRAESVFVEGKDIPQDRYLWFKNLKDRVQPKQEWSKEDENRINRLIAYFEDKESFTAEDDVVYANWLKSLRPPYYCDSCKLKKSIEGWKPSDEQLKSLQEVIDVGHFTSYPNALETLYEQLKKLRNSYEN